MRGFHPRKLIEEPNITACQLISAFTVMMTDGDTDERGMAGIALVTLRVYNGVWWQERIFDT